MGKKFEHLNVPSHWKHYWTKYPEGYTILEALLNWVAQVDKMVDNINDWNEYLDDFVMTFDKDLRDKVVSTLREWQDSGFLDVVIDEALQTQMDVLEQETHEKLNQFSVELAQTETDIKQREINVRQPPYNATINDGSDVVAIINQAITDANASGGGTVYLPDGVYSVGFSTSNIMIQMKSNVVLKLANNAVIKALPNGSDAYAIVQCKDISNFKITGGTIQGERHEHTGTTGEWGMGINLLGASDFIIDKVTIKDCWGDGIYISESSIKSYCEDGKLIDVTCDGNRRQGISFISGKNIKIVRPVLKNTSGYPPEAGIDFEPNKPENLIQGVVLDSPYTENNGGAGIVVALHWYEGSTKDIDLTILNHTDVGSVRGLELAQLRTPTPGKIKVINPYWKDNQMNGFMAQNWSAFGVQVDIHNPTILNPNRSSQTASTYGAGIAIIREPHHTVGDTHVGNINIYNPIIKDITVPNLMTSAIVVRDFYRTDQHTKNVSIIDPVEISGYGASDQARMWYTCESGGFISDKRRVLEHDLADASITINTSAPYSVVHNESSTTARVINLGAVPTSWKTTIELRSANQITIYPPATETIYPIGTGPGKGIRASTIGAKVTLRKINSTSWIIEEMVGEWIAL